jgi:hypothetical protein
MSAPWLPVVGDLVQTKEDRQLLEVLQVHLKTREICLRPYHKRAAFGVWKKLDEIEEAPQEAVR